MCWIFEPTNPQSIINQIFPLFQSEIPPQKKEKHRIDPPKREATANRNRRTGQPTQARQRIIDRSKIPQKDAWRLLRWIFEPTDPAKYYKSIFSALSERNTPPKKRKNILLTRRSGRHPPTATAKQESQPTDIYKYFLKQDQYVKNSSQKKPSKIH